MTTAPYGSWASPFPASRVSQSAVSLRDDAPQVDGDDVYWAESRPHEGGRSVVCRLHQGHAADAVPTDFNARTRVHEYGGGSYVVRDGVVYASRFEDQRVYRIEPGQSPQPITPEPERPAALRYADPTIAPRGRALGGWGIWVREAHHAGPEPTNDLVRIPLDGSAPPSSVASGHDFYGAPRLSPDGRWLAFLAWDHPHMPWNGTLLYVAPVSPDGARAVGAPRVVAGGAAESIVQPIWSPGGELYFSSDRSGFWNPYRADPAGGEPQRVHATEGDVGSPAWRFGYAHLGFLSDGTLAMLVRTPRGPVLRLAREGEVREVPDPAPVIAPHLAVHGRDLILLCGAYDAPIHLERVSVDTGARTRLVSAPSADVDPAELSRPEAITFQTPDGPAHAYYYPPHNPAFTAPDGELPPLLVLAHGGPTAGTSPSMSLGVQYWTSRGFAVVDVNYGGSTGYGRAYWERLAGAWGEVDVRDCALAAQHLVAAGKADPARLAIRGGSAGGYTTLAALAFRDDFAAGASHYGIGDLEELAKHTHKFESRYEDWLVGPLPEARETYRARSPVHHADRITSPVILFQGADDRVVPQAQAEQMAATLRERGVPVTLHVFEGEGHGFRKAENQITVLEEELAFYGRVFGFAPRA